MATKIVKTFLAEQVLIKSYIGNKKLQFLITEMRCKTWTVLVLKTKNNVNCYADSNQSIDANNKVLLFLSFSVSVQIFYEIVR